MRRCRASRATTAYPSAGPPGTTLTTCLESGTYAAWAKASQHQLTVLGVAGVPTVGLTADELEKLGVVVAVMPVPQSLAYAMLAGLPPQAGLLASLLPLLLYALVGSSSAISVGLAPAGSSVYVAMVALMALGSAVLMLALTAGSETADFGRNRCSSACTAATTCRSAVRSL